MILSLKLTPDPRASSAVDCLRMIMTAKGVVAAEAVSNVWRAIGEKGIELLCVDPEEVLACDPLDDGVVHGRPFC